MKFQFSIALVAVFLAGSAIAASRHKRSVYEKCSHVLNKRQACTLFPMSVEGPYYLDDMPQRSDITEGKAGVSLSLTLQLINYTTCQPMPNLVVDLWSADALGEYSGWHSNASDTTSFRGYQVTNSTGYVTFQTIIPGWYEGRSDHIHVNTWFNSTKHVGQFFLQEAIMQQIARLSPYSTITTYRLTNDEDWIYNAYDGGDTLLTLSSSGSGYAASLVMGFDGSEGPDDGSGPGEPGPGPQP